MHVGLDFIIEPFRYDFMRRGLLSALFLGISGGLVGSILVLRRLALMGDALTHSLLPGIAIAWLLFGDNVGALFAGALFAGLFTALGSALVSRTTRVKEDAAFGSLFLITFALGIAVVSAMGTRVDLAHFLFGNVLGVSALDTELAGICAAITVLIFFIFFRGIVLHVFDPIYHRAIGGRGSIYHFGILTLTVLNLVAALQTMGIVLALGLFLLPATTAYLWCDRLKSMFFLSVGLSAIGSFVGVIISYHTRVASGPSIVLSLGVIFLVSALIRPEYGVLAALARSIREGRGVLHTSD